VIIRVRHENIAVAVDGHALWEIETRVAARAVRAAAHGRGAGERADIDRLGGERPGKRNGEGKQAAGKEGFHG